MNETVAPQEGKCVVYRVPIRERIRVAWENWKCRKVGKAVRTLSKALKDDAGFRQTWHANIAMPIYDATRPKCYCGLMSSPTDESGHTLGCKVGQAQTIPRRFECRDMSIEQANYIADQLMEHLFKV